MQQAAVVGKQGRDAYHDCIGATCAASCCRTPRLLRTHNLCADRPLLPAAAAAVVGQEHPRALLQAQGLQGAAWNVHSICCGPLTADTSRHGVQHSGQHIINLLG